MDDNDQQPEPRFHARLIPALAASGLIRSLPSVATHSQ